MQFHIETPFNKRGSGLIVNSAETITYINKNHRNPQRYRVCMYIITTLFCSDEHYLNVSWK